MYNHYGDEPRLNKFILISVILHAILFLTFPEFHSLLSSSDIPGMTGGVIQVIHVETSINQRYSPVTDRLSQTSTPRVTEPRPIEEEPTSEPITAALAEVPEIGEPQVERSRPLTPAQPEPPLVQEPEPEVEEQPHLEGEGGLLTSELGPELVVDEEAKKVETAEEFGEQESQPDSSGSGEGIHGEDDDSGTMEPGEGSAESAPPAPAPLPSGFSLYPGGGQPIYPKDAAHEEIEGTVIITVQVSASGQLMKTLTTQSSEDRRLDLQAQYEAEMAPWPEMDFDYEVDIEFNYPGEEFVPSVSYGPAKPLDAP